MTKVRLAIALSFAGPRRPAAPPRADELALAHQLLDGLDQRSNALSTSATRSIATTCQTWRSATKPKAIHEKG
ncbi:hypothetical protein ACIGW7_20340 [Streptomyces sp. NPDC053253]|uniref:hypothetical protein n=1 Tax=Streptomyces sp. NPDC053253 TaxID=3365699 RepID=UPI0037D423B9